MKRLVAVAILGLLCAPSHAEEWKAADYMSEKDVTRPILIPPEFMTSKFGKGKYRLDGPTSYGQVNCIFLFFEPDPKPSEAAATDWKAAEDATLPAGTVIFEKTLANPFKPGDAENAARLRVRITAKDAPIGEELKKTADEILARATTEAK